MSASPRIIVFAGPSLPDDALSLHIDLRPPATRRALKELADQIDKSSIVVLLDGAFLHQPAPTHYDFLYMLRAGIRLIGASSMGALRAAELRPQGMHGIGVVYEAIIGGLITDDSELAVAMCPFSYRGLTVPLVRVRSLLYHAVTRGLPARDASAAFDIARGISFLDRTPAGLARSWQDRLPSAATLLAALLQQPETDVKAADARRAITYACDQADTVISRPLPLWG